MQLTAGSLLAGLPTAGQGWARPTGIALATLWQITSQTQLLQNRMIPAYLSLRMQLQRHVDMTIQWSGMGGLKGGSQANVLPTDNPDSTNPDQGLSNSGADSQSAQSGYEAFVAWTASKGKRKGSTLTCHWAKTSQDGHLKAHVKRVM